MQLFKLFNNSISTQTDISSTDRGTQTYPNNYFVNKYYLIVNAKHNNAKFSDYLTFPHLLAYEDKLAFPKLACIPHHLDVDLDRKRTQTCLCRFSDPRRLWSVVYKRV